MFHLLDTQSSFAAKEVHMTNLKKIVEYCENVVDCRRSMQLNYFAEHFTSEQCLENPATACDNCLKKREFKVSFKKWMLSDYAGFFVVLC